MVISRVLTHIVISRLLFWRQVTSDIEQRLTAAVTAAEIGHEGEIRVVIEARRSLWPLMMGETPRRRAEDIFAIERVWDTEKNCGVLLYLCYADRSVELVADRGLARVVRTSEWETLCADFRECVSSQGFVAALEDVVDRIGKLLRHHYPLSDSTPKEKPNELPDGVVVR